MKPLLPQAEYIQSLPQKRMGVCVLLFDEFGKLLIVKPNYKEGWSLPGGVIDANESPCVAAIRETKEEIGLEIPEMQFLLVEYVSAKGESTEGIEFVFSGGILSSSEIASITIASEELDAFEFKEISEALIMVRESIKRRIEKSLPALKTNVPLYSEFESNK